MTESTPSTDFTIEYPSAGWSLRHPVDAANGPRHLCVDGHELLHSFLAATDATAVDTLVLDKSRAFRKSGSAVFESAGHYGQQAQHSVRQIIRYAGNCGRITVDLHWGRGDSKLGVAMSVLRLPGEWRRLLLLLPADGEAPPVWRELQSGKSITWREVPLSMIFEDHAGRRVEYSTGFDLWRWHYGLGVVPTQMQYSLRVSDDELLCYRQVMPAGAGVEPQVRDYRFCSMLAWSAPALTTSADTAAPALQPLAFLPDAGGVDLRGASGERGAYSVDFGAAAMVPTAYRQGASGERLPQLCWSSKATVAIAKRVIRQLAAAHNGGTLRLLGMPPGVCHDGSHCERRQATMHWDLQDLLNFAAWARQTLGDDWTLQIPQPAPWNELPSLAAMGAISGFRQDQG
ncbi:MAG: hypothetical protein PHT80_02560 [Lentisphaeria bacterium]|nr:hypothetical protein [Lentisphaeria bacterium]